MSIGKHDCIARPELLVMDASFYKACRFVGARRARILKCFIRHQSTEPLTGPSRHVARGKICSQKIVAKMKLYADLNSKDNGKR